ncbi:RNA polymerase sigma factor [Sediminibacterium soli]|uniref:RNA polymerase sigma factor n=1 Tax=Sediminibacterium soli TaxID=2698829 RepID=UPI001379B06A|nr:RNA polymerase sigma factor [Sediminibacterium soli]NCI45394.1 RNA polymerase sigma factor [Sediminibacterium soli]
MSILEFNRMLENQSEALRPFAITLTRDHEAAQDLYQETLFRALANKDKYHMGTNLKAWLYTIMRNIFINNYRKKTRHDELFDTRQSVENMSGRAQAVENDAIAGLHIKEIKKAIHGLPEIFRNPFLLYFDGYRYHEIARMMREPLGTIKSRIHFARKLLKTEIDR